MECEVEAMAGLCRVQERRGNFLLLRFALFTVDQGQPCSLLHGMLHCQNRHGLGESDCLIKTKH